MSGFNPRRQVFGRGGLLTLTSVLVALASTHAAASRRPALKFAQMLEQSRSVLVATVLDVDDAGQTELPDYEGALTKVTARIDECVAGACPAAPEIEFFLRGGLLPDGALESWSTVPNFAMGDTYLLFFRKGEYTVQPFVRSTTAILRFVRFGERELLVDEDGRLFRGEAQGAGHFTAPVMQSMPERQSAQRQALQSSDEVFEASQGGGLDELKDAVSASAAMGFLRSLVAKAAHAPAGVSARLVPENVKE